MNNDLENVNIKTIKRVVLEQITTGNTGNIALDEENDGYTYIISPIVNGMNCYLKLWIAHQDEISKYYLTATNPNTGETYNNTKIDIRYIVIRIDHL